MKGIIKFLIGLSAVWLVISFFPIAITIFLVWGIYKLGELLLYLWNEEV